jgi:GGDEF domain-containing protein
VKNSHIREAGQLLTVTVSIGGTLARKTDSAEGVLKRADSLLYESKGKGRNRCTIR